MACRNGEGAVSTDDDYLIEKYIVEDPHRPGAAGARVVEYDVPVWALIGYLRAAKGDVWRVATDYGISVDAVRAAEAYYQRHRAALDARLTANAVDAA